MLTTSRGELSNEASRTSINNGPDNNNGVGKSMFTEDSLAF